MTKKIDTVVNDVYKLLEDGATLTDKEASSFGTAIATIIQDRLQEYKDKPHFGVIRLSGMGKGVRQLWYGHRRKESPIPKPSDKLKFLFGDITEELLLFLVKKAGHAVTEEQQEVIIDGVVGHKDCRIDGVTTDIKSASPFAFKKFTTGALFQPGNDPFGYRQQVSSYAQGDSKVPFEEYDEQVALLVMDKSSGDLCLVMIDDLLQPDAVATVKEVKRAVLSDNIPDRCYEPEPEGKSGNMKLSKNCFYCIDKEECWKDMNDGKGLRKFKYSKGLTYLTHVEKEPQVEEIL